MEKKLLLMKSLLQTCFFGLKSQKNLAVLLGTLTLISLFDFLFYNPVKDFLFGFGINCMIMSVIALAISIVTHQPALNNRTFWWAAFGYLASAINIAYEIDNWSVLMLFLSHILVVSSIQLKNPNNLFTLIIQWFILQFSAPFYSISFLFKSDNWPERKFHIAKVAKLLIIPIVISGIFLFLYGLANEHFYDLVIRPILDLFQFDRNFPFVRVFIWILSAILFLPLMIPIPIKSLIIAEHRQGRFIKRTRSKPPTGTKTTSLNQEIKISTITLLMLNAFVFLFNGIDVAYVWTNQSSKTAAELSQFVHNGTNMTILSIALGAGLLLFSFRKNLNFHSKNIVLKKLSYLWLAQNAFLASSTFMRNWQYVSEYGLTYKRFGVVIFIILVLVGLLFTYQKISTKHTFSYFFKRLSLAFYLILVAYSLIDHPKLIIKHAALMQKGNIDVTYLNKISYSHKYLMAEYKEQLEENSDYEIEFTLSDFNPRPYNWRSMSYISWKNDRKMAEYEGKLKIQSILYKRNKKKENVLPEATITVSQEEQFRIDLMRSQEVAQNEEKKVLILDEPVPELETKENYIEFEKAVKRRAQRKIVK